MTQRRLWAALAWTIGGSVAATFTFAGANAHTPWPVIVQQTLVNILFSGCCVALCVFLLPYVVPVARRRIPFPFDWVAILVILTVFGLAGSFVAAVITTSLGYVQQPLITWYPASAKVSIYFTLIFGLAGTAVQELRSRLASTTLALRTKERDEAEARRLVAEAQLASLESRVDPHFLFNTLNSIAALIRENPAAAERVVEQLASLMRSSLDRRAALVTLDDELALVKSYLEIERVRFGDRLRFHIEPASGSGRALVPRLSLQTLVENGVKYAVSPSREGAAVDVRATTQNGRLRVAVEDDGPGFDASRWPEGHGLHLLKERLSMTFGDRASLTAESRPGRTIVVLDLPVETVAPQRPSAGAVDAAGAPRDERCL
jgi:two-component system sensor histidine kinase AlgZ